MPVKKQKHKPLRYPQTPQTVHEYFQSQGICISEWARSMNFSRMTIADLLRGRNKGNWGESHRAAVALGLKPQPKQ